MKFPKWQVHRGYWQEGVRENTLAAFEEAAKRGAKMVELDVQLSREGIPHVFHDYTLKRFFHIEEKVCRVPSEDLKALNVAPLENILQSTKIPNVLNIEIKSIDIFCLKIAKKVCDLIREKGGEKKILISSFNPMCLFWARRLLPELPRALIVGSSKDLNSWKFSCSVQLAKPSFINAHYKLIDTESTRDRLLSFRLPVMVWTVNDLEKAKFYLERGAVSIISDLAPISKL